MPRIEGSSGGGSGDALTTNPLSQFAATTSAQLRSVVADANTLLLGYATTATAAGTTTLTATSANIQHFTGVTTQTVALPVTSTLSLGFQFRITNLSTGALTVNSSGGNLIATVPAKMSLLVTCILTSGTTAASWNAELGGIGDTGTATHVLTSNGPGSLPTFQAVASPTTISVFTASDAAWAIPAGAVELEITCIAGGGQGGGGSTGAAGTFRTGAQGGGPGGMSCYRISADQLGATAAITVGAGGTGAGVGGTGTGSSGTSGGNGGDSSFVSNGKTFSAQGGTGGVGATAGSGGASGAGVGGVVGRTALAGLTALPAGLLGGSGNDGGATAIADTCDCRPTPGGGAGGVTSGDSPSAGADGGDILLAGTSTGVRWAGAAGGVASGGSGGAGGRAINYCGLGGGGGAGSITTNGGAGGAGGLYGAGGGGGAGVLNGYSAGNGGNGAAGVVIVKVTY